MATILRSRHSIPLRPTALLLPTASQLPTLLLQLPASYRSFHASPQPQFLDAAIATTQTLFESLHSLTGLPWVYTLPLAALTIRTTLVLPLTIYSRRAHQHQAALSPLLSAWQHQLRKETMREMGHLGPAVVQQTVARKVRQKQREVYKRLGCPRWKNLLPLFQLPSWLLAIETIRKMCGAKVGLLGLVAARLLPGAASGQGDLDGSPAAATAAAGGEEAQELGVAIVGQEASFATEGALWFPDLLLPDPQMILPFMLSGAIMLNLAHASSSSSGRSQAAWQKRLLTSMKIVALAIGPLTLHVPSAMLVYWISSSTLAYVQAILLDRFMPVKLPVVPCKQKRGISLEEFGAGGK